MSRVGQVPMHRCVSLNAAKAVAMLSGGWPCQPSRPLHLTTPQVTGRRLIALRARATVGIAGGERSYATVPPHPFSPNIRDSGSSTKNNADRHTPFGTTDPSSSPFPPTSSPFNRRDTSYVDSVNAADRAEEDTFSGEVPAGAYSTTAPWVTLDNLNEDTSPSPAAPSSHGDDSSKGGDTNEVRSGTEEASTDGTDTASQAFADEQEENNGATALAGGVTSPVGNGDPNADTCIEDQASPGMDKATATDTAAAAPHRGPWDDHGAGLVHRRVAQWYVPGLEKDSPRLPPIGETVREVVTEAVSAALQRAKHMEQDAATALKQESGEAALNEKTPSCGGQALPVPTAAAATKAVIAETTSTEAALLPAKTSKAMSVVPGTRSSNTAAAASQSPPPPQQASKAVPHPDKKAAQTDSGGSRGPLAGPVELSPPHTATDAAGEDDAGETADDEELPKILLSVQANRNKRLKRILMACLGSDFAKAGLSNDGVRTSFSIVNYQTIKQLTGLGRIPAKLLMSCLVAPDNQFNWVDISMHPTATLSEYKEALQEVLLGLGVHRTMVEDSAEPMLLPQVTVTKKCYSLLMRYAIEAPADKQMDSFQDLTNRFTVFIAQKRIITIHRTQCAYVEEMKLNWQQYLTGEGLDGSRSAQRDANGLSIAEGDAPPTPKGLRYLLYYFVKETVGSFTQAIAKCIVEFDKYEANLFSTQCNRSAMARDIYHIKRRASVYGRTLTLTQDAYAHIASALHIPTSQVGYQEIMHDLAHVRSLAEELNSNADSVLQLLFQLSSYQVNELMRVLTLFSAFFIPLSFIASVYGMNFNDLPLLHNDYGGLLCSLLMGTVATCIYLWFRANRFI